MATQRTLIDLRPGTCVCGCTATTERRFKPGHDQRTKYRLLADHLAGRKVTVTIGKTRQTVTAVEAATYLDTARFSWSAWLETAQ